MSKEGQIFKHRSHDRRYMFTNGDSNIVAGVIESIYPNNHNIVRLETDNDRVVQINMDNVNCCYIYAPKGE